MAGVGFTCPRCFAPWPATSSGLATLDRCPACQRGTKVEVFPALFRPLTPGASAQTVMAEGEAACFYHAEKRAVVPCGVCGRFLCALCDSELNGRHFCPGCLDSGQRQNRLAELETRRTLYDGAALSLAVLGPVVTCFWGSILTAPVAIGLALYSWRKPGSILPRTRAWAVLAVLLGLLTLAGWGAMIYAIAQAT